MDTNLLTLKDARQARDMTQAAVAEALGLALTTWQSYERRHRTVPPTVLNAAADLFTLRPFERERLLRWAALGPKVRS